MGNGLGISIIGAGVFGGYHAGKIAAHPKAHLSGIYDPDIARAQLLAQKHDAQAFSSLETLLAQSEAVIIASPASTHADMALRALKASKHVLIEKPLATDMMSAKSILETAKQKNLHVQVGHQERFVLQAIGLDRVSERPTHIEAKRFAPYGPRCTDVSVTLDLMVHDIDMVLWLMGTPTQIAGRSQIIHGPHADTAQAKLSFAQGTAQLSANRVEAASTRTLHLTYPSGDVFIDFNARTLTHSTPFDLNPDFGQDARTQDALGVADAAFIDAIITGTNVPITGEDGLAALKVALAVDGKT